MAHSGDSAGGEGRLEATTGFMSVASEVEGWRDGLGAA